MGEAVDIGPYAKTDRSDSDQVILALTVSMLRYISIYINKLLNK